MDIKKRIPISTYNVELMKTTCPKVFEDMCKKWGEENVINNLLIPITILTEDSSTVYDQSGKSVKVNKELIKKAATVNNNIYKKYVKEPIHKLKQFISGGDQSLGDDPIEVSLGDGGVEVIEKIQNYTPITINHDERTVKDNLLKKIGFIKDGSYKVLKIDGKHHLVVYGILIDPEAKFNYLNGNWSQVSPTLDTKSGSVSALSVVLRPAQTTNVSMSAPTDDIIEQYAVEDWDAQIEIAREKDKINNIVSLSSANTDLLLRKGIITSASKFEVQSFMEKLDPDMYTEFNNILSKTKRSPLQNKPQNFFINEGVNMGNYADGLLEFTKANQSKYKTITEIEAAYKKHIEEQQVSLGATATGVNVSAQIDNQLKTLKEAGSLDKDVLDVLSKYLNVATTDTASLSAPQINTNDISNELEAYKKAYAAKCEEAKKLQDHIDNIKKSIGG